MAGTAEVTVPSGFVTSGTAAVATPHHMSGGAAAPVSGAKGAVFAYRAGSWGYPGIR